MASSSTSRIRTASNADELIKPTLVELCAAHDWKAVLDILHGTPKPSTSELTATTGASQWAPLHFVASAGPTPPKVLTALLELGPVAPSASAGSTPLHLAAWHGNVAAVSALLDANAPVGAKSAAGRTALHFAARRGHAGVAAQLISAGADVNSADREGRSPLHAAAAAGAQDVTSALLEAGADPHKTSKDGRTAGDVAADAGYPQMADGLHGLPSTGPPRPSESEPPDAGPRWLGSMRSTLTRARSMVSKVLPVNNQQDLGLSISQLSQKELTKILQTRVSAGVEISTAEKYNIIINRAVERYGLTGALIVADEPTPETLISELLRAGRSMENGIAEKEGGLYHTLVRFVREVREARAIGMIQNETPSEITSGPVYRKEMYMAVGASVFLGMLLSRK